MKVTKWPAALLCGIALVLPVAAQEEPAPKEPPPEPEPQVEEQATTPPPPPAKKGIEEPALHRWGGWTVSLAAWQPSLVSADEELATSDHAGTPVPLIQDADGKIQETLKVVFHLPKGVGSIAGQYDAMGSEDNSQFFTPGQFDFAESRAYPITLGAFDDGTADGVAAHAMRRTHEYRLEFQKQAFDTKWARATWGAGLRGLSHARTLSISYYAIVPNFPPAFDINDIIRLIPFPDQVGQTSSFSGNGLGASFDVVFPLHPRFAIVSGISLGLVRGKAQAAYSSLSSYYARDSSPGTPLTTEEFFALLSTPPDDQGNGPIDHVFQQSVIVRLSTVSNSLLAQMFDVYVGFEVPVWRGLKVFGTMRDVYYANVGEYAIPTIGFMSDRKTLNAGYEGYCLGLSWRF